LKKFAAILLLALFLFNLIGYRVLFTYLQQRSDATMEASIDNNDYNQQDLITITVPLSMPYQLDQKDFERVSGEINVNGKVYKYVQRKVSNGELVLQCLPDENKMKLQSAKDDFFKFANDLNNSSKKSGNTNVAKNWLSIYDKQSDNDAQFSAPPVNTSFYSEIVIAYSSGTHISPEQPPDFLRA
jgi:hypothetical protein